jgi:ribose/xylose/arabinose/galactoside ABC-type transport system permease subunit
MLLGLVQLLLICSFIVFITMPVAFVVLGCTYLFTGKRGRGVLIAGLFVLGALASGAAVWQLVPSQWTLPFWTTLKATVDAEKYGHAVEHYAEGVVMMMTFAALIGGAACAGGVALGSKLLRRLVRP